MTNRKIPFAQTCPLQGTCHLPSSPRVVIGDPEWWFRGQYPSYTLSVDLDPRLRGDDKKEIPLLLSPALCRTPATFPSSPRAVIGDPGCWFRSQYVSYILPVARIPAYAGMTSGEIAFAQTCPFAGHLPSSVIPECGYRGSRLVVPGPVCTFPAIHTGICPILAE